MDVVVHTLIFGSHIAALDSGTGMGLLVLPDPDQNLGLLLLRPHGQAAELMSQRWFSKSAAAHATILRQLCSIGWDLPRNNDGDPAWFDAGRTSCCGRLMISLSGIDVDEVNLSILDLIESSDRLRESTESACLTSTYCRLPAHLPRQGSPDLV